MRDIRDALTFIDHCKSEGVRGPVRLVAGWKECHWVSFAFGVIDETNS